jgi:hypothetical protein
MSYLAKQLPRGYYPPVPDILDAAERFLQQSEMPFRESSPLDDLPVPRAILHGLMPFRAFATWRTW